MTQIKLYLYAALAIGLVSSGFWFKSVLADRKELRALVSQLQSGVAQRDEVIGTLKQNVASTNATLDRLASTKAELERAMSDAQTKIQALQSAHQMQEVEHQKPLPNTCEEAVREAARRAGAK